MAASGLICVVCVLGAGVVGSDSTISECRVVDVVRYCGNGDFICKVDDVPKLEGVHVRVKARGVLPAEDAKAGELDEVMGADLANAGRIILRHVRMRNYFRAEADVEVDGRPLAEHLVAKGVAQRAMPKDESEVKPMPPQATTIGAPLTAQQQPALRLRGPGPVRAATGGVRPGTSAVLKGMTDISQIREDTTFGEALEIIRHAVDPPLPMVVMWKDIEDNAFVERTTPVGIEGLGNTTLGNALKLVLMGVSTKGGELEYVVDGGLVTIASKAMGLGNRRYTRAYDAGEILASPAGLSGMYGGGGGYGGGMFGNMGMGNMGMGNMGMGNMGMGNMGVGSMNNWGSMGNSGNRNPGSGINRRPSGWGR